MYNNNNEKRERGKVVSRLIDIIIVIIIVVHIYYIHIGETAVMVAVNGPMDVSLRDEKLDEATVEFVVRPATGFPQTKDKLLETILRSAFEPIILTGMMPRTLVEIVVQVEKDDGSVGLFF